MLFNSPEFPLFFLAVFALYWALPFRGQNWLVLGASYVFYGWWGFFVPGLEGFQKVLPLALLLIPTVATHYCAKGVNAAPEDSRRRRAFFRWRG